VPGIWLLLSVRADESLVTQCWEAIRDAAAENGAGAQERAERLLALLKGANSQRGTVGFALIAVEDRLTRAAGSGDIAVRAEPAAEAAESLKWQTGSGPQDWRLPLPLRAFQIGDPADPAATGPAAGAYPLVAGVVMASSIAAGELRHDESGGALAAEAQHPELGETRRSFFPKGAGAVPRGPQTVQQSVATPGGPLGARSAGSGTQVVQSIGFAALGSAGSAPRPASQPSTADDEAARVTPPPTAAVAAPSSGQPSFTQPATADGATERVAVLDQSAAAVDDEDSEIEDSEDDDEEISSTVYHPANRDQNTNTATGPSTVAAVKCLAGHLNPPQAKRCRVCPQPVPAQRETHVPRPVLGVLRLSTGEDIPLDRDVLLGRQPKLPSPSTDKQHVLRLPSPGKDISRNHLHIRLVGWRVVATDLGSTNGTTIRPPDGGPAEALPPGGTRVIEPGAEVTLAGVVSFIYEATG
jgi:hypothetical protein